MRMLYHYHPTVATGCSFLCEEATLCCVSAGSVPRFLNRRTAATQNRYRTIPRRKLVYDLWNGVSGLYRQIASGLYWIIYV